MALTPPACLHLLTRAAMARLQEIVQDRALPGTDAELSSLLQLLSLAGMAVPLSEPGVLLQADKWCATLTSLIHRVMPLFAELIAEDEICEIQRSAAAAQTPPATPRPPAPPPEALSKFLGRPLMPAHRLFFLYAARRVEAADAPRASQVLPLALEALQSASCELEHHLDFLKALVPAMLGAPEKLSDSLLDEVGTKLLLPLCKGSAVVHKLLLNLLEGLCLSARAQLLANDGAILRRLNSIAHQGRQDGEVGEEEVHIDSAYERLNQLMQRVSAQRDV
uniref:Uncharacterized protein n=1 Tax=Haptolina ericina TaxID=156174 RepID=A0A7S3AR02_9EUKA